MVSKLVAFCLVTFLLLFPYCGSESTPWQSDFSVSGHLWKMVQKIMLSVSVFWARVWGETDLTFSATTCEIAAQSYSAAHENTRIDGFVELNGRRVWNAGWFSSYPNLRGINTMIVNPFSCKQMDARRFDTWEAEYNSEYLATYLQYVRDGAVIVGVTGDEPRWRLAPALMTLAAAGVHVSDVKDRGNFVFVIQKGYPEKTVYRKSLTNANPTTLLNVTLEGSSVDSLEIKCL